ncbi:MULTISPECIES: hypothetical protein [Asaia]|uniref:hypothetical protein n=1 Tax=Asaia TaxID=91914 RepID=UPI002555E94C|nr:hypothetical protein [Asaia sp. HumB]MDL2171107.1 hypothetical protein [Asaia sp. HumB]
MKYGRRIISKCFFGFAGIFLITLAIFMIVFSCFDLVGSFLISFTDAKTKLLKAISIVVIALAVFDVAKYFLEEEFSKPTGNQTLNEARVSLMKFVSSISIALFVEGLVGVFEASDKAPSNILYPAFLILVASAVVLTMGVYQRMSVNAEKEKASL